MKQNLNEKLLHDVLKDASEELRQEIFEASLAELRRRKRILRFRPRLVLAIAAAIVLSLGLLFVGMAHRTRKEDRARLPQKVQNAPALAYAPLEIVTSRGPAMSIVESRQYPAMVVQNSSFQRPAEILGDSELLALFSDKPAGLIRDSHGAVQLVLLDPRDEMRFLSN